MNSDNPDIISAIDLLNEEAEKLSRVNPTRMLEISLDAKARSEAIGYTTGLARALCNIGTAYWRMSNYPEALSQYQRALSSYEELQDDEHRMRVLLNIGLVHQSETKYDKALENFQNSLQICEDYDDLPGKAVVLANIGAVYHNLGRYEKATEYLLSALSIAEELGDRQRVAGIIGNLARTYIALGKYDPALNYQLQSLEIYQSMNDKVGESRTLLNIGLNYERRKDFATTLEYYNMALASFEEIHDRAYYAATLLNIGGVYSEKKNYELALNFLEQALAVTEEIGDRRNHSIALTNIGNLFFKKADYPKAAYFLERALVHAESSGSLSTMCDIYNILSEVYESLSDPITALSYFRKHAEIKEKIQSRDVQRSIAELHIRFEVEKSEKEKEIYRLRNVELANLLSHVEELNKHLISLNNEKNDLLGIVAHDLKNPLTGILMSVSLLQSYGEKMTNQDRNHHLSMIESATKRMSKIITRLLDIKALESGKIQLEPEIFSSVEAVSGIIESYRKSAEAKGLQIHFTDLSDATQLETDKSAFREIIENLISNAVKYSPHGKEIFVSVKRNDGHLLCTITDEGPGFTETDKQKIYGKFARLSARPTGGEDSTGLGLSIAKKFSEMLGAKISFISEPGRGTTFSVNFPLKLKL